MLRINGGICMIDVKEEALLSFLYKVKEQAVSTNEQQLFSWTKEIAPTDLLDVFASARKLDKNRLFWTNSDNDLAIFGIGTTKELLAEGDRFQSLETKWKQLLEEAMIHDPFQEMGTGLTMLGGMTFDPERESTALWEKFPAGKLVLPAYSIVRYKEKYFATLNQYLQPADMIHDVMHEMEQLEATLYESVSNESRIPQRILHRNVIAPEAWKASIQRAVDEIKQDKAKKIVMAREMRIKLNKEAAISELLRRLLKTQSNSYVFALEEGDDCFLGATPERLVLIEGNKLLSTCLAGTAPRGKTEAADKEIAEALLHDEKNLEEHAYVVQMIKEAIAPSCEDIFIPDEPVIYPLRNLQHLYTPVQARLKSGYTVFDIVRALHPTPALGGLPRNKALSFIREEEYLDRGWYGAPVGWLDSNHNSEFVVAIRSGLVQKDEVSLFAGCGVMRDSNPELEFEETNVKFLPILNVLEDADGSY